ncbi:MAG: response regulator transcription factor, partial [Candidatus Krumholzibacteria bacterium]|nr:response regulator transcription factor [Candidatus Krumholzibacteria bacterium]
MASRIRILLAEDHTIVRQGLRKLIEEGKIDVVGEVENGEEAVARAIELDPDVIIMDISMPLMRGIEATRRIKREAPRSKVIILTIHSEERYLVEALEAGADGYVVKGEDIGVLMEAIEAALAGRVYLSGEFPADALEKHEQR